MKQRYALLIGLLVLGLSIVACGGESPDTATTSTQAPAHVVASLPRHAHPELGDPLADFKTRYGQDNPQSKGGVTSWVDPTDNGPLLHGGSLIVTYTKVSKVTYITYSGPDGWTLAKYKTMMQTFIPSDAVINTQASNTANLIAYTSKSIGAFDFQFTGNVAAVNLV